MYILNWPLVEPLARFILQGWTLVLVRPKTILINAFIFILNPAGPKNKIHARRRIINYLLWIKYFRIIPESPFTFDFLFSCGIRIFIACNRFQGLKK